MTLVSPPPGELREATSRRDDHLRRRACSVFERCDTVPPPTLPALAAAFADYLLAGRELSREHHGTGAREPSPQRLHEQVVRLDSLVRLAEQVIEPPRPVQALVIEFAQLEDEAARLLAETRDLLRCLDAEQPAARRLRLALVAAWGRYDDALATVRPRAGQPSVGDPSILAAVRDALVRQLESARALCAQSGQASVDGTGPH